jgi:HK97 family phage portal protein
MNKIQQLIVNLLGLKEFTTNDQRVLDAMYPYLGAGLSLNRDSKMQDYIAEGYEKNPDVFSIVSKAATMFAQVPVKIFKGETEIAEDPLAKIFEFDTADYSLFEFKRVWECFNMVTGNAISHLLRIDGGANKGQIGMMRVLPTQYVEILSGGSGQPISDYILNLNPVIKFVPDEIWHVRGFDNLDYTQGKNFMGISPVKVAALVVQAQNNGYEQLATALKNGMPPGILYDKTPFNAQSTKEQQEMMEKAWINKIGNPKKKGLPIFSGGEKGWLQLGFSNLRDLQIVESSQQGLRVLCNIWGMPAEVFNDKSSSTYNNMTMAYKAIYTNRIVPDATLFYEGINKIIKETGIRYVPDWGQIQELQPDKKVIADTLNVGVMNNSLTLNEFREALGYEADPLIEGMRYNDLTLPEQIALTQDQIQPKP